MKKPKAYMFNSGSKIRIFPKCNCSNLRLDLQLNKIVPSSKRSQIGMEYVIIMGFVLLSITLITGLAFVYSGSLKDKIRENQVTNFANKVITTSESVYYSGEPSKATISVYLPEYVKNITISNKSLYLEVQFSSGLNKIEYKSNVPLSGSISTSSGMKKIIIEALENEVEIK